MTTTDSSEFADFCGDTTRYLRREGYQLVFDLLSRGALPSGKWHPTGFAVFHLVDIECGHVRFHVWPQDLRRTRASHPSIHCHDWHLASLVLAGTYQERLFEQTSQGSSGLFLEMYQVTYQTDGLEGINKTGEHCELTVGPVQTFTTGQLHYIKAGVFHETHIADRAFVATVLITGRASIARPLLLGSNQPSQVKWLRPVITHLEMDEIYRQCRIFLPQLQAGTDA
jgi:hypothetical protein